MPMTERLAKRVNDQQLLILSAKHSQILDRVFSKYSYGWMLNLVVEQHKTGTLFDFCMLPRLIKSSQGNLY